MNKNKALSVLLIVTIVLSTCLSFFICANAQSPNLLEMYGYDPSFSKSLTVWKTLENAKIERVMDSFDNDSWCAKVSQRDSDYSVPSLMDNHALEIFLQQGAGIYYYSFYVKCAEPGQKLWLRPQFQLIYGGTYSKEGLDNGSIIGKWLYGSQDDINGFYVNSTAWTKIEMTVMVNLHEENKMLGEAKLYASQADFDGIDGQGGVNAYDLLFDDFTLIKMSGSWSYINPTSVPTPTPTPVLRPYPIQTEEPNVEAILPMPTLTAEPNVTSTATPEEKPISTPEIDKKDEIVVWDFSMIAKDMFSWNNVSDAEEGIQHYFDNKTRMINWALITLIIGAIGTIIYTVISKNKKEEIVEQENQE